MMDDRQTPTVKFIQVTPRSQVKQTITRLKQETSRVSSNSIGGRRLHSRFTVKQQQKVPISKPAPRNHHEVEASVEIRVCHNNVEANGDDLEAINLTSEYDLQSARRQKAKGEERVNNSTIREAFSNVEEDGSGLPRMCSDESLVAEVEERNPSLKKSNKAESESAAEDGDEASSTSSKAPSLKEAWHTPSSRRKTTRMSRGAEAVTNFMTDRSEAEAVFHGETDSVYSKQDILGFFTNGSVHTQLDALDAGSQLSKFFKDESGTRQSVEEVINYNAVTDHTEEFVQTPPLIGHEMCCKITRDRKGVDRGLYPTYYLHLERPGGKKILLLAGRKRKKSTTSNYLISTDVSDLSRDSNHCVGKVRSNLLGTQFTIYGSGPSIRKCDKKKLGPVVLREELAAVVYEPNVLGFKGPRRMKVVIPEMKNEVQRQEHRPDKEGDGMLELVKRSEDSGFFELRNKSPVWNEDNQSFVLNFHGRVTQASVKNFQIIHEDRDDYVILQFGKTASETFTMDYRYPLNALQAFAIVLTSFDNKLACE